MTILASSNPIFNESVSAPIFVFPQVGY
jgi:hypothetical protein